MADEFKIVDGFGLKEALEAIKGLGDGKWRITITRWQERRGLSQNAIFQTWAREFAAHVWQIPVDEVSEGDHEGAKRSFKQAYYQEYGFAFVVHKVRNPITGQQKMDFTSSAKWSTGEMFHFLTWLQRHAGNNGCILESKGEYQKLKERQND